MPRFSYSDVNFDIPPVGVYLAQVSKAEPRVAKSSGNEMIVLSLRTIPDGYSLKYYLVFSGKKQGDGVITQFCRHCEGELMFPEDPNARFSLTPADCFHRLVFIDVVHDTEGGKDPQAKIKFAGILPRTKALAIAPHLANIRLPANVPPPQSLAIMPAEEATDKSATPSTGALPDMTDDLPFSPNHL